MMVSVPLKAQETIIKIIDSKSDSAIQFANVCIESVDNTIRKYVTSNTQGYVTYSIQKRSTIAVSALGFISVMDTINPGETKTIALNPTVYDVDEVVITGQFSAIKADKSIYKIEVINNQQIKNKGANNLSELLATELNLRASQDASLGTNISIQGLSGEHVKILIDGVPVIGRQNGILDLSQVLLSNVDHVEIVEGPMSVVYGSNALAGVINLITRKPPHGRILGKINTYYESVGVYNADVECIYRNKNQVFTINGGRNFFGGYSANDTSRNKQWKPKAQYFATIGYAWSYNKTTIKFNTNLFYEDLRNKGPVEQYYDITSSSVQQTGPTSVTIGYRAFDEYHYTTRWNSKVEYQQNFGENYQLESFVSYASYKKIKNTFNNNLISLFETPTDSSGQDTTQFGNIMFRSVIHHKGTSWFNFQGGVDLSIETAKGKRISGVKQIDDYALFGSIQLFADKQLNIQGGIRAIYNSKYKAPLIYAVNIKYSPSVLFGFRASYGKGFRAPSLKELYLSFTDINHNISGNSALTAEHSNNVNVSVIAQILNRKNHFITADGTMFFNAIENKIDFIYDYQNPTWAQYFNITDGNYKSMGAALKLKYQLHPRFNFQIGANYLVRSQVANVNNYYKSTDYMVDFNYKNLRYLFRIALFYKYTDDWYTSRTYFDKNNQQSMKVEDGFMKGYHTLDFTVSRPFFKNHVEVFVGVRNLFDNKNISSYGSGGNVHSGGGSGETPVGWGRTFFVKLGYNLMKY
jgi:outer membrane receptor for ferrienterochelin and colicins